MDIHAKNFIDTLEAERKRLGWSDAMLCRTLDISPSYWCMVKDDKRPIGKKLFIAVQRTFPNLRPAVLELAKSWK